MYCKNCGVQIPNGSAFCPNCGTRQGEARQYPPQTPYTAQPYAPPARREPWHSRGRLSPNDPHKRRVSVLFTVALAALQVVLFLLFASIAASVETDMLTAQIVGFVPTVVLIVYLFCLDTIEKEPPGLLLKLFLVEGILTMLIVAYVELGMEEVILLLFDEDTLAFRIVDNLIGVALVEELFKYCVLKKFTWKHPAFNYRFDGIVYAAVTALGFAAFENFAYVSEYGFGTALIRMVSAVPGHCVDGILMGIFYGQAKLLEGRGDRAGSFRSRILAILAPIAEHGFYDFFANVEGDAALILFYAYVFLLNATVFVLVWRLAQKDEAISRPQMQYAMRQ